MIPGMNPKQMASLMKQMGIKNEDVPCSRVVFEKKDGGKLVIEDPQVMAIEMQGQRTFQVSGAVKEEAEAGEKSESDADLVMKETGCSKEEAEKALEEANGDLAEAIIKLKK